MLDLSIADSIGLAFFLGVWVLYRFVNEHGLGRLRSLSVLMNEHRMGWMRSMSTRDSRIADASIMSSLQNGAAFFASTSLILLGGAAASMRATDDVLKVFGDLPFGLTVTRGTWELKVLGLALLFGYSFFKFAWAYRLFIYAAILLGATPGPESPDAEAREKASKRAGFMTIDAGLHFAKGLRSFYFAFAYIGWFVSPYVLMTTTAAIFIIVMRRQFFSAARASLTHEPL
ncbi:conserved membrane hypothetical protein [Methylocella tundrae]|uniref:DUF599 domain-containing protein n=1 Tax=Methylocella tundrae TaxID=227605 RepID=A0A8B6M257_METTU|nr:DUF599 family protein [Methylocella tundrae]VTZ22372.1 conserved membrane hypothetical protein [Methylocella tundrae]VTZ49097.1 conserved membrane hypothetical protein [Methylocella tundrae]